MEHAAVAERDLPLIEKLRHAIIVALIEKMKQAAIAERALALEHARAKRIRWLLYNSAVYRLPADLEEEHCVTVLDNWVHVDPAVTSKRAWEKRAKDWLELRRELLNELHRSEAHA